MWLCKLAWCFLVCCAGSIVLGERGAERQEVVGKFKVKLVCFYSQWIEVVSIYGRHPCDENVE